MRLTWRGGPRVRHPIDDVADHRRERSLAAALVLVVAGATTRRARRTTGRLSRPASCQRFRSSYSARCSTTARATSTSRRLRSRAVERMRANASGSVSPRALMRMPLACSTTLRSASAWRVESTSVAQRLELRRPRRGQTQRRVELTIVDRLGEVREHARRDRALEHLRRVQPGQHDHRPPRAVDGQVSCQLDPVAVGEVDVEQVEVGPVAARQRPRLDNRRDRTDDLVPQRAEPTREPEGDDRVVLSDEDAHPARGRTRSGRRRLHSAPGCRRARCPRPAARA